MIGTNLWHPADFYLLRSQISASTILCYLQMTQLINRVDPDGCKSFTSGLIFEKLCFECQMSLSWNQFGDSKTVFEVCLCCLLFEILTKTINWKVLLNRTSKNKSCFWKFKLSSYCLELSKKCFEFKKKFSSNQIFSKKLSQILKILYVSN